LHLCDLLSPKMIQQAQIPSNLWERKKDLHFFVLTIFYIIREVAAQGAYLAEIKPHITEDAAKLVSWNYSASCKKIYEKDTKSPTGGGAT